MIEQYFYNLTPAFQKKVLQLLDKCDRLGYTLYPFCGARSPQVQAEYWGKGRTKNDVFDKVEFLKSHEAYYLAEILSVTVPDISSNIITNALPGLSWHQWGEAMDCFWLIDETPEWDISKTINGISGYEIYAQEASKLGLTSGYNWKEFKDAVHIQLTNLSSPLERYSWKEIDNKMQMVYNKV